LRSHWQLIGRIGETSHAQMNKEWEVRMIPPGDDCDGDHLTLWLFFSCVRNFFLLNWRDIDQKKANGFLQWWGYWVSWLDFGE
jgi:hypothetical protein